MDDLRKENISNLKILKRLEYIDKINKTLPKLTDGQKYQALLISDYSLKSAFRYVSSCEKARTVKCLCGSLDVVATLEPAKKKARDEDRQSPGFKPIYRYICLNCGEAIKNERIR